MSERAKVVLEAIEEAKAAGLDHLTLKLDDDEDLFTELTSLGLSVENCAPGEYHVSWMAPCQDTGS